jgi:hypothetical protein
MDAQQRKRERRKIYNRTYYQKVSKAKKQAQRDAEDRERIRQLETFFSSSQSQPQESFEQTEPIDDSIDVNISNVEDDDELVDYEDSYEEEFMEEDITDEKVSFGDNWNKPIYKDARIKLRDSVLTLLWLQAELRLPKVPHCHISIILTSF